MTLLDLISDDTKLTRKTAQEWAGPCPACGGRDRFIVFAEKERYWCRGCGLKGDAIQYLRDFRSVGYREACELLGQEPRDRRDTPERPKREAWTPKPAALPGELWQAKAAAFLSWAEENLWSDPDRAGLEWLHKRGLRDETIRATRLGWNPTNYRLKRSSWGIPDEPDGKGRILTKFRLPAGVVIPLMSGGRVTRLRIRRRDEDLERDRRRWPDEKPNRYWMVKGCFSSPCLVLGAERDHFLVVESELDALLLAQEAGDLVGVVALGSVGKRPDAETWNILCRAKAVLVALDGDEAGRKQAWGWWAENVPGSTRWPCLGGKDPTEAWKAGRDLRTWAMAGILETWPDDLQEPWQERAAIVEYDGEEVRDQAEERAFECLA